MHKKEATCAHICHFIPISLMRIFSKHLMLRLQILYARCVELCSLFSLFPNKMTEKAIFLEKKRRKCFANKNKNVTLHRKTTKKYKHDDN